VSAALSSWIDSAQERPPGPLGGWPVERSLPPRPGPAPDAGPAPRPHPAPRPDPAPRARPAPRPAWEADAPEGEASDPGERAEDRLARLAAALGPLRRVLAALAERLVATEAPARLGYARLRDYARERTGLSARQLQELARVDRALAGLPGLERALVANELPWSKVRLVARVASVEDEAAWIARARAIPSRELEQAVRASAPGREPAELDEAVPETRVAVRCTPAVREKWALTRELAERQAGQSLRAGEVFELVVAEALSGLAIDPAFAESSDAPRAPLLRSEGDAGGEGDGDSQEMEMGSRRGEPPPPAPARAPARELPAAVAALAAGLADADAFELDRRLRQAVRLEQTLDAALAPLLRRVLSAEYEWRGPYVWRLARYAPEQLGISASKARALLRLERAGELCPELRQAYRDGRLSWVKAHCLLPLLLLDLEGAWRPAWVAWAERVTIRRLEADVERALLLRAGHPFAWERCKYDPERAQDPLPPQEQQLCAPDLDLEATQELSFRVPCEVASLYAAARASLRAELERESGRFFREGEVFGALLEGALLAWTLRDPRARRPDPVIERDGYLCAVPGCSSRRNLHDHHIVFRSAGGSDAQDNRITLCAFHHQRALHVGLLRIRGRAPGALVFELGLRPGAPPLVRYRSGDIEV
jgi:hypothetical protein